MIDGQYAREAKMNQSNIAGIILCLMGMLLCAFPLVIWKISEKWKSKNASTPSTKYITTIRIVGGTFIGLGILLALGVID